MTAPFVLRLSKDERGGFRNLLDLARLIRANAGWMSVSSDLLLIGHWSARGRVASNTKFLQKGRIELHNLGLRHSDTPPYDLRYSPFSLLA